MSKLIYGVGYNSRGQYKTNENGKKSLVYRTWHNMIQRCYSPKLHLRSPTYIGCTVTEEWLDFQVFAAWFDINEYSGIGYQLDKDILSPNNKVYSPEKCCFIPRELNSLLLDCSASRGKYPQGVNFQKHIGMYKSELSINGRLKNLGCFECPSEAYQVYKAAKEAHVRAKALEWKDRISKDVFDALMEWRLNSIA